MKKPPDMDLCFFPRQHSSPYAAFSQHDFTLCFLTAGKPGCAAALQPSAVCAQLGRQWDEQERGPSVRGVAVTPVSGQRCNLQRWGRPPSCGNCSGSTEQPRQRCQEGNRTPSMPSPEGLRGTGCALSKAGAQGLC